MTDLSHFYLNRQPSTPLGTMGDICDANGIIYCDTCERPWLNNEPDISCIPPGTYIVIRHNSSAHPNTWEITEVPGRTGILLHTGNTEQDSLGCIILGNEYGEIDGLPAVLNSVETLAKLNTEWPDTFLLTISFS